MFRTILRKIFQVDPLVQEYIDHLELMAGIRTEPDYRFEELQAAAKMQNLSAQVQFQRHVAYRDKERETKARVLRERLARYQLLR